MCANDCGARTCAEPFNASASSQYGQLGAKRATVNRRLHNNQTLKNFDRDGDRWSICCFLQNIGKISRYRRTAALDVAIPRNSENSCPITFADHSSPTASTSDVASHSYKRIVILSEAARALASSAVEGPAVAVVVACFLQPFRHRHLGPSCLIVSTAVERPGISLLPPPLRLPPANPRIPTSKLFKDRSIMSPEGFLHFVRTETAPILHRRFLHVASLNPPPPRCTSHLRNSRALPSARASQHHSPREHRPSPRHLPQRRLARHRRPVRHRPLHLPPGASQRRLLHERPLRPHRSPAGLQLRQRWDPKGPR